MLLDPQAFMKNRQLNFMETTICRGLNNLFPSNVIIYISRGNFGLQWARLAGTPVPSSDTDMKRVASYFLSRWSLTADAAGCSCWAHRFDWWARGRLQVWLARGIQERPLSVMIGRRRTRKVLHHFPLRRLSCGCIYVQKILFFQNVKI